MTNWDDLIFSARIMEAVVDLVSASTLDLGLETAPVVGAMLEMGSLAEAMCIR